MYLKSLEITGFKSFADKTVLHFEPGMTAIVGPNGCGKSNISDAIRWVLGEQSAKALRGSKMEDVIFNGTDFRKPLGMCEVNITFSDCEKILGTEYNEVTISRRVFRTGEGQYFINKTPCRLKDIQRLFMDTGVGTDSYSLLEQGRIDRILSSRPEDRREIFEEASGITRYKADRKEAMRKLEQTEANLLRLSDVIREVKRQIGSLQRQAGKARRYKELHDELRGVELYLTRERLTSSDLDIKQISADIATLTQQVDGGQNEVRQMEQDNAVLRENLVRTEREIGTYHEAASQARSRLEHTHQIIEMYRQRIAEYRAMSDQNSREMEKTRELLVDKKQSLEDLTKNLSRVQEEKHRADTEMSEISSRFENHKQQVDSARGCLQKLREESVEVEGMASRLHNDLMELESREKSNFIQRERLAAEKTHFTRTVSVFEQKQEEMLAEVERLKQELGDSGKTMAQLLEERTLNEAEWKRIRDEIANTQAEISAVEAKIEMLGDSESAAGELPGGSRALLANPDSTGISSQVVQGLLASHVNVEPEFQTAFEAAMRPWLDAVVVTDTSSALAILNSLAPTRQGSVRLLAASARTTTTPAANVPGIPLLSHVKCSDAAQSAMQSLLQGIRVVDSLNAIPNPIPEGISFVTREGQLASFTGAMEFWMPEPQSANPVSRKHLLEATQATLATLLQRKQDLQNSFSALHTRIAELEKATSLERGEVEKRQRDLALKEGESGVLSKEAADARSKLETVEYELTNLTSQTQEGLSRKQSLSDQLAQVMQRREALAINVGRQNSELRVLEDRYSSLNAEVTERRIAVASLSQKIETLEAQHDAMESRILELEAGIKGHSDNIVSSETMCRNFEGEITKAETQTVSLEKDAADHSARVESLSKNREKQAAELESMEKELHARRESLENLRNRRSQLDVSLAENKMKRQNMVDRVSSEYSITLEDIASAPEPAWENGKPELDVIETTVAELRTKIEAMGPVNLVAIEEYKELEERFAFLTAQEQDLVNSKQQLMDLIRKINRDTTEMFRSTFERVNANFDTMFQKLFNGGNAKLVLVNEEDILECGIEIIARPPGKRLQNVSLLSGGERTMTAVALLFAIYMIKPSPFCLLDELDAALDDANIGRFVSVLSEFIQQSQFVVITHNRRTIGAAAILYGVTMPEKGISKIVSMKFKEYEAKSTPTPAALPASDATPQPVLN